MELTNRNTRAAAGPLDGIRVVEFSHFLAGPYAGLVLADLGAEVVKLEDLNRPDAARTMPPFADDGTSLYFAALNWAKRSVGVDLSTRDGRHIAAELVTSADVFLDNYRPGVLAKAGLDRDVLRTRNPALVTCSLSGYGADGPHADRPGYDYTIQAMTGVMSLAGEPEGPPTKAGISYVDHSGGLAASLAVCATLLERTRTGRGRHVDLGLLDVQFSMLSYLASWSLNAGYEPGRTPLSSHPTLVPAQNFETADGWLSVFVGNNAMWWRFVDALGDGRLADPRFSEPGGRLEHRVELVNILAAVFRGATTSHWVDTLSDAGVACAPVNDLADAMTEPQVLSRELIMETETAGGRAFRYACGPIPKLSAVRSPHVPRLGEHTSMVLAELGVPTESVARLRRSGVVGDQ